MLFLAAKTTSYLIIFSSPKYRPFADDGFRAGGIGFARGGVVGVDFDRPTTQVNVNNVGRRGGVIAGRGGGFIAGGGGFGPRPLLRGGFRRLQENDIEGEEFDDEQFDDEQFENGHFDDEQMDRVEAQLFGLGCQW